MHVTKIARFDWSSLFSGDIFIIFIGSHVYGHLARIYESADARKILTAVSQSDWNKKLSYRRETARQMPTWREGGVRPSSPLPLRPLWLHLYAYG